MSVLAAIAVLALLIVVHELGHFLAARLQNIHVNRFSIGFGPALWKYQGPETEYAIRSIPLGGYVGFPDEDPESTIPLDDPNLLRNRPVLDRAIVISAGVIANLIFAYFLLVMQFATVGVQELQPGVAISQVSPQLSLASRAGFKSGDIILAANETELGDDVPAVQYLKDVIQSHPNQNIKLLVKRGDKKFAIAIKPELSPDGKGRIGVQLAPNGDQPGVILEPLPELSLTPSAPIKAGDVVLAVNGEELPMKVSPIKALMQAVQSHSQENIKLLIQRNGEKLEIAVTPQLDPTKEIAALRLDVNIVKHRASSIPEALNRGANEFQRIITLTFKGLMQLISNFSETADQLSGPVAIVAIGADIARSDASSLFQFAALISINLAIINTLPLPALDGGQLVFLLIEGLRGKPLPTKIQDGVMQTGLMLLLGLGIFLIIRDTANLVGVEWMKNLLQQ
ncbi:RIP metalloprotease RseP [Oscillatoriales cyanobacterium USR001]|nr:RIP metalloprotease RseP [Oscillatoriales cyanobacterium USR001]